MKVMILMKWNINDNIINNNILIIMKYINY